MPRNPHSSGLFIRALWLIMLLCAGLIAVPASVPVRAHLPEPEIPATVEQPAQAAPLQIPSELPVFNIISPEISSVETLSLSSRFAGIGGQKVYTDTSHADTPRFTVVGKAGDEQTGTPILEQYGASSGFFAYNATRAFAEEERGPFDPQTVKAQACDFLLVNELFPFSETAGEVRNCQDENLPYEVTIAKTSNQTPDDDGPAAEQHIAAIVRVPLSVQVGLTEQQEEIRLPMNGPGGHLSLLFTATNFDSGEPTLGSDIPGLAAYAQPWFDQDLQEIDRFTVVSENEVIQQLRDSFPGTNIEPGTPVLAYYVGHPAEPQEVMMPMWSFPEATAEIDGQTAVLRTLRFPGVTGFLPSVEITSPQDNTLFTPGESVTVTGSITGGEPPYTYTLALDDGTVLGSGTTTETVTVETDQLPVLGRSSGVPISTTLRLSAGDSRSAEAADIVSLRPSVVPALYLPLITRGGTAASAATTARQPDQREADTITLAASNYSFGLEWVQDYDPPGSGGADLPGVPPDGNGFDREMRDLGWSRTFRWTNYAAWERDWRDCSLGGLDCSFGVDRADFVYFAGHGSPSRIYFGSNQASGSFFGGQARYQNVRWMGFATCQTLRVSAISDWFNAFQGAHMLMGYQSNMADIAFGGPFVDNMRIPTFIGIEFPALQRSIREAWVQTVFEMNAGKPAYIYARGNGVNPVNNKLPRSNDPDLPRPFPVSSWHWVWWE